MRAFGHPALLTLLMEGLAPEARSHTLLTSIGANLCPKLAVL